MYDFTSLDHTSVVSLRHHCASTVGFTVDCDGFLFLVFALSGSIWVQHVLQYVFAFTRGQVVEEVQRCHLNVSKMPNRNDINWKGR